MTEELKINAAAGTATPIFGIDLSSGCAWSAPSKCFQMSMLSDNSSEAAPFVTIDASLAGLRTTPQPGDDRSTQGIWGWPDGSRLLTGGVAGSRLIGAIMSDRGSQAILASSPRS